MSSIECTQVSHAYGSTAVLDSIDLSVADGTVMAVIGRSGSGKSTLLRLIAGFERTTSGQITIGGEHVSGSGGHLPSHRRQIGYVPQDAALFPHLTVAGNIGFGVRGRRRHARVDELIELVGLDDLGRRYPHELSGGQQQRVALARALAIDPRVVLLDEPFAALDAQLRTSLRREVLSILRRLGTTTILVTHDQDEALSSADRIAFLDGGHVRQTGTPKDLYDDPIDPTVARFLGRANFVEGAAKDGLIQTPIGPLTVAASVHDGWAEALVRPEQIRLDTTADGRWEVGSIEYLGHESLVELHLPHPDRLHLTARYHGDVEPLLRSRVAVSVQGPVRAWAADR